MEKTFSKGIKDLRTGKIINTSDDKSVCEKLLRIILCDPDEKKKNYKIVDVTISETKLTFDEKTNEMIRV